MNKSIVIMFFLNKLESDFVKEKVDGFFNGIYTMNDLNKNTQLRLFIQQIEDEKIYENLSLNEREAIVDFGLVHMSN